MILEMINISTLVIIFIFGFYYIHVTDSILMKSAYATLSFGAAIMLLFAFVPTGSAYYGRTVLWQPVLLRAGIAFYCVARFIRTEIGTYRFTQAFKNNNKKVLIEIDKN